MRKITRSAYQAFIHKKPFAKSNTTVRVSEDGSEVQLLLHNNVIAKRVNGVLSIRTAGWPTATTKERLNSLPGVRIHQAKGVWYLNDLYWDGDWIIIE